MRKEGLSLFLAAGVLATLTVATVVEPSGLSAQYFRGPDFSGPVVRSVLQSRFSSAELSRGWGFTPPDAFSVQWSGYLFVERTGLYSISVNADDGARLFIDRQPVIVEQGQGPGLRTAAVRLDRGPHAVLFQYFEKGGGYHLEWVWSRDAERAAPIPPWSLSPRPRGDAAVLVARWMTPLWWPAAIVTIALATRALVRSRCWPAEGARALDHDVPTPALWRSRKWLSLVLFAGFAILQTWPLVTNPSILSRNDNADTLLNEWILAWVAHQLPSHPLALFEANIFYPERRALAFSEPLIVQSVLAAPLLWLGASPVLAYNVVLLAGLTLTGWAMAMVVARWTSDWVAGLTAGIVVAFNAHTLTRLPHLQAQHAEFLPLALYSLDSLLRMPSWASSVRLAIWFCLQALTSIYLLVFTATALAVAALVRPEDWAGPKFKAVAARLVVAAAIAGLLLSPFLLPYWWLRSEGFERSLDEAGWFAASLRDYWSTPSRVHGWLGTSARGATSLFPGLTALALLAIACLAGGRAVTDRRLRMCLAFGVVGFAMSFGPIVPGYPFLYSNLPLFQAVRGAARFGYLALVAVAVGAGFGVAALRRRMTHLPRVKLAGSVALVAFVFFEPFAAPIGYERFAGVPSIYGQLNGEARAVVAHLPFPPPDAIYRNAAYMLGSTLHFKPLLNGYSGFLPPSYVSHYSQLANFPNAESMAALRRLGVTHIFVHLDRLDAATGAAVSQLPGLRALAVEGSIALYGVQQADLP